MSSVHKLQLVSEMAIQGGDASQVWPAQVVVATALARLLAGVGCALQEAVPGEGGAMAGVWVGGGGAAGGDGGAAGIGGSGSSSGRPGREWVRDRSNRVQLGLFEVPVPPLLRLAILLMLKPKGV